MSVRVSSNWFNYNEVLIFFFLLSVETCGQSFAFVVSKTTVILSWCKLKNEIIIWTDRSIWFMFVASVTAFSLSFRWEFNNSHFIFYYMLCSLLRDRIAKTFSFILVRSSSNISMHHRNIPSQRFIVSVVKERERRWEKQMFFFSLILFHQFTSEFRWRFFFVSAFVSWKLSGKNRKKRPSGIEICN